VGRDADTGIDVSI
jgi:hypothetical protein